QTRKSKLEPIEGQPPDLGALGVGCRFLERCDLAVERCAQEDPPLVNVSKTQWSACWNHEKLIALAPGKAASGNRTPKAAKKSRKK
ncbi:MAG: oligopeptide/dipeptide ABC transporter ATP-binding protein, partial [Acidobacteriota bacterium]